MDLHVAIIFGLAMGQLAYLVTHAYAAKLNDYGIGGNATGLANVTSAPGTTSVASAISLPTMLPITTIHQQRYRYWRRDLHNDYDQSGRYSCCSKHDDHSQDYCFGQRHYDGKLCVHGGGKIGEDACCPLLGLGLVLYCDIEIES